MYRAVRASVVLLIMSMPCITHAAMLSSVSDTISTSEPSKDASHVLRFTTALVIPAGGSITIHPEGAFSAPASFAYNDVDVAVDTGGGYVDRALAATPSASEDGFQQSGGDLTLTLNSSTGIPAQSRIRITLGLAAGVGDVASSSLANPSSVGSYRIRITTANGSSQTIDNGSAMIAVVQAVGVSIKPAALEPVRFNGSPSGTVAGHTSQVELSLQTVNPATCRYGTTASTTYASMSGTFTGWDSNRVFSANVAVADDTTYTFYVRCKDRSNLLPNTDDYVISFSTGPAPDFTTSIEGNGIIGNGGSGEYPNGSSVLFLASVILRGWSAPNSTVEILKDGTKVSTVSARSNGSFESQITGLERGVYTFVASSKDGNGYRSSGVSTTLTLQQGTTNTVKDLLIPPTVGFVPAQPEAGTDVDALGATVPNARVELSIILKSKDPVSPQTFSATSTASGSWRVTLPKASLQQGTYIVKVRTVVSDAQKSDWGTSLIGIGETANTQGDRSDLNRDGKVNLVDFSILLTTWGTDGRGDINQDGTTNLADFSIMLFDWTG